MATFTWVGGSTGNTANDQNPTIAANWTESGAPSATGTDDLVFKGTPASVCVFGSQFECNSIKIESDMATDRGPRFNATMILKANTNALVIQKEKSIHTTGSNIIFRFTGHNGTSTKYVYFANTTNMQTEPLGMFATEANRSEFTFEFTPASGCTILMEDGVYPNVEVNTGTNAVLFSPTYCASTTTNTYGFVDILDFDCDARIEPKTHVENDLGKKFSFEGTVALGCDTSPDATITTNRNKVTANWGFSTVKFTSTSTGFYLPVTGDVNFGTQNYFSAKYFNIEIGKSSNSTHVVYMRNNVTLYCNSLKIDSGAKLYAEGNFSDMNCTEIHTVQRPNVLGDWNYVQVADGVYRSRGSPERIPVTSGGTGLDRVSDLGILYGDAQGSLDVLDFPTSSPAGKVLAINSSGNGFEWSATAGGGGNAYDSIAVAGQDSLAASAGDDLTFVAAGGMTITTNATTDTITFSSADNNDNTQNSYTISCVDGDNTDEEKIRLTQSGAAGSATDDIVLEAGTGLSIARSGDKITFTNTVTDSNLDNAGVIGKVLTGLDDSAGGALAATDTILAAFGKLDNRVTLNDAKVTNANSTTFTLRGTTNTTPTTVNHGDTITIAAGTGITTTSTSDGVVTIANTVSDTTYTAGTNISLSGTTFNVDDAFLKNDANDATTGTITAAGFTTTDGQASFKIDDDTNVALRVEQDGDADIAKFFGTSNELVTIRRGGSIRWGLASNGASSAEEAIMTYIDTAGSERNFASINDGTIVLHNRGPSGDIEIRANNTTAGASGEVSVADFQHDNIQLKKNTTITGNLTITGTSTTVDTTNLVVEDPLISLAKDNNSSDAIDIGFYGLYDTSGSTDLYAGLFRDADDSGKFKLFKDLQAAPTTTVNTGGTGYAVGTLVANLEGAVTGNVTGNASGLSSTLAVASGGTGATNSNAWLNSRITTNADGSLNYDATSATAVNHDSLTGFVAAEHYRWDNDISGTAQINAANIPTLNQNTSGTAAGLSSTLAVASGGTGVTANTTWLNAKITTKADGTLNYDGTTAVAPNHDSLAGFVAAEHYDWSSDISGTATIHANNIPTLNQNTTGNAATATTATNVVLTDNENTDEANAIVFAAGADVDGSTSIGLESDGDLTYNPSTGKVSAGMLELTSTNNEQLVVKYDSDDKFALHVGTDRTKFMMADTTGTDLNNVMVFQENGTGIPRVGIHQVTPTAPLHVGGEIKASTLTSSGNVTGTQVTGSTYVGKGGARLTTTSGFSMSAAAPSSFDCVRPNSVNVYASTREIFAGSWNNGTEAIIGQFNYGDNASLETFLSAKVHVTIQIDGNQTAAHSSNYLATYETICHIKDSTTINQTEYASLGDTTEFPIQWKTLTASDGNDYLALVVTNNTGGNVTSTEANNGAAQIRSNWNLIAMDSLVG